MAEERQELEYKEPQVQWSSDREEEPVVDFFDKEEDPDAFTLGFTLEQNEREAELGALEAQHRIKEEEAVREKLAKILAQRKELIKKSIEIEERHPLPKEASDISSELIPQDKNYLISEDEIEFQDLASFLKEYNRLALQYLSLKFKPKKRKERPAIIKIEINHGTIQARFDYRLQNTRYARLHFNKDIDREAVDFICKLIGQIEGEGKIKYTVQNSKDGFILLLERV